jgi:pilus assembly protein Flp/PilA
VLTNLDFLATWIKARFHNDDQGASLVEYALLVALIAVVCIVAVGVLGKNANTAFESVGQSIGDAVGAG